ncbi:hypothetical protein [Sediminicola sp. 1XM1-17]|uniref:hypothetical protein n=1 Tax=Sediminicola sp. 1XM1-17 TaxID=3127702 RepID=UPI0030783545
MTLKNSLLVFFALFSFAINAQTEIQKVTGVTEFKVETDVLEELTNFDWEVVADIFEANAPETEIKIVLVYDQEVKFNNVHVDNFELVLNGKTSELVSMIEKSKGMVAKLSKLN